MGTWWLTSFVRPYYLMMKGEIQVFWSAFERPKVFCLHQYTAWALLCFGQDQSWTKIYLSITDHHIKQCNITAMWRLCLQNVFAMRLGLFRNYEKQPCFKLGDNVFVRKSNECLKGFMNSRQRKIYNLWRRKESFALNLSSDAASLHLQRKCQICGFISP